MFFDDILTLVVTSIVVVAILIGFKLLLDYPGITDFCVNFIHVKTRPSCDNEDVENGEEGENVKFPSSVELAAAAQAECEKLDLKFVSSSDTEETIEAVHPVHLSSKVKQAKSVRNRNLSPLREVAKVHRQQPANRGASHSNEMRICINNVNIVIQNQSDVIINIVDTNALPAATSALPAGCKEEPVSAAASDSGISEKSEENVRNVIVEAVQRSDKLSCGLYQYKDIPSRHC